MLLLFAQSAVTVDTGIGPVLQIAGPLGVGSILAWFMWYTVSVTLPKKDEAFTKTLEGIEDKQSKAIVEMQQTYLRERTEWRTDFREALLQKTNSINALASATNELIMAVKELTAKTK